MGAVSRTTMDVGESEEETMWKEGRCERMAKG